MTASGFFASIGLPEIVAGILVLALNAYVLMGGADYGGGLWDLLASGQRREEQRELIANSIAPVWEANHVWLIVAVVLLFTAFPIAFGLVSIVLHIPLTIMLVGIVLRGSSFVFRSYGGHSQRGRKRWGVAFASASIATPILLGVVLGTIASGAAADAAARVPTGSFVDVYVTPWLAPFPIAVGGFALSLFSFLAAVYLTVEARSEGLREDFRVRGLIAAGMVLVFAALALLLSRVWAPRVAAGVMASPWSILLHTCTGVAAITAIFALATRRWLLARFAAAAQVTLIIWGWALSQYPYILPTSLTIRQSAAPPITLRLLLIGLAGGGLILIPSLRYLFRTFAGRAGEVH